MKQPPIPPHLLLGILSANLPPALRREVQKAAAAQAAADELRLRAKALGMTVDEYVRALNTPGTWLDIDTDT